MSGKQEYQKMQDDFVGAINEAFEIGEPRGEQFAILAALLAAATGIHCRLVEVLERMDKAEK